MVEPKQLYTDEEYLRICDEFPTEAALLGKFFGSDIQFNRVHLWLLNFQSNELSKLDLMRWNERMVRKHIQRIKSRIDEALKIMATLPMPVQTALDQSFRKMRGTDGRESDGIWYDLHLLERQDGCLNGNCYGDGVRPAIPTQ